MMINIRVAIAALLGWSTVCVHAGDQDSEMPGSASFVVPSAFPTSVFSSYYIQPAATQEPQPALYDPVLNITYPLNLTNPNTIPTTDDDPVYFPHPIANITKDAAKAFIKIAVAEVLSIIGDSNSGLSTNCSKCIAALTVGKLAAQVAPKLVPPALVSLCISTGFGSNSTCTNTYEASSLGAVWTQVLAFADVSGLDGQYICNSLSSKFCPAPSLTPLNTTGLFPKPKPADAKIPPPSGKRVKVLHLSDFHLDPRYSVGSEANCTKGPCCRHSASAPSQVVFPSPLYGAYRCDSPYYLGLAALQSIGPLTGTNSEHPLEWVLFTGDLASHDPQNQLSRAYVEYAETSIYSMFKSYLGGPVYATLGNHDSSPENIDGPHSLPGPLGRQFSWNYDHVASLWEKYGWVDSRTASEARLHYGGYSVKNHLGLRIISLNTDLYYRSNIYNFINSTNPDNSGIFSFLIQELQAAEDAGERVWIIGHVLTGWDGFNPLLNPSNLFYAIVDRYSPHVIANVFFGHTHEDQVIIYYANNGTVQSASQALTTGWIGPSITPGTNVNSGYRLYEVDTCTFDVYDAYTFYADVNTFPTLNATGPTFQFEYSTRDAYPIGWPEDAPLNATYWHQVTVAMEANRTLVEIFNTFQGKSSILSPNCTSDACAKAKVCYIRSGSAPLGKQCPQGFGSVQSPYTGTS